jgi:hypothetical protein
VKSPETKPVSDNGGKGLKQSRLDFSKAKPKSEPLQDKGTDLLKEPSMEKALPNKDKALPKKDKASKAESSDSEDAAEVQLSGNKLLDKFHDMSVKERRRLVRS